MSFKLLVPAVLALMIASTILWLPEPANAAENWPVLALAFLTHTPAFLPVSHHGRLLQIKSKWIETYPELIIPPMLAIAWIFVGVNSGASIEYTLIGAAVIGIIAVCYIGVRACDRIAQDLLSQVCQSPSVPSPTVTDIGKRFIYFFRSGLAALSLTGLLYHAAGQTIPIEVIFVPIAVGFLSVATAVLTSHVERRIHADFSEVLPQLIERTLVAAPTSLVVYHAGTSKNEIAATRALCEDLERQGEEFVLIVREAGALEELRKLAPLHLWHAERLSALAHCAQARLSTTLYASDHPKNSHFTRYTQFEHSLAATYGRLANIEKLPKTVALYDKVLAKSSTVAARWRANSPQDVAARISVYEADAELLFLKTGTSKREAA